MRMANSATLTLMRPPDSDEPYAYLTIFERHFNYWVRCACAEQYRQVPGDEFYRTFRQHVGDETVNWIGWALKTGLIVEEAHRFRVLGGQTGPFRWFSRRDWMGYSLHPNWEAYFHVAFFVRLRAPCEEKGITLTFEDKNMDLAVWRDEKLLWCIEVKVNWVRVQSLIAGLRQLGQEGVALAAEDRGNDPLRKAKYLILSKPTFFSVLEPGLEHHFQVEYEESNRFHLRESEPPVHAMDRPPPTS